MKATLLTAGLMFFIAAGAFPHTAKREPHMGYLYPAGGQQGRVFTVVAGGQNLKGVSHVHVSGEGVSAVVTRYLGRVRRLNSDQRQELRSRLNEREGELLGESGAYVRPLARKEH